MTAGLTALQKEFTELMVSDNIMTNKEMAEALNCDERTIYKMRRNEKVCKEIERLADAGLKVNIGQAYNVLTDILFSPDAADKDKLKALEVYLKTQGKLKDRAEVDTTVKVSTTEQAAAELEALLDI